MMNDRSEDHVVVRVPAMLKQKYFPARLQNSNRFREKFFAGAAGGNFVRAESKTNRVARGIRQWDGEMIRLQRFDSRVGFRRHFQVADVPHSLFRRFALDVPAIHGLYLCLRQYVGKSEEHTSELQSQFHLVCRLLLEKKKKH